MFLCVFPSFYLFLWRSYLLHAEKDLYLEQKWKISSKVKVCVEQNAKLYHLYIQQTTCSSCADSRSEDSFRFVCVIYALSVHHHPYFIIFQRNILLRDATFLLCLHKSQAEAAYPSRIHNHIVDVRCSAGWCLHCMCNIIHSILFTFSLFPPPNCVYSPWFPSRSLSHSIEYYISFTVLALFHLSFFSGFRFVVAAVFLFYSEWLECVFLPGLVHVFVYISDFNCTRAGVAVFLSVCCA